MEVAKAKHRAWKLLNVTSRLDSLLSQSMAVRTGRAPVIRNDGLVLWMRFCRRLQSARIRLSGVGFDLIFAALEHSIVLDLGSLDFEARFGRIAWVQGSAPPLAPLASLHIVLDSVSSHIVERGGRKDSPSAPLLAEFDRIDVTLADRAHPPALFSASMSPIVTHISEVLLHHILAERDPN